MKSKNRLFLTDYLIVTAIAGSVPPSPREKALARLRRYSLMEMVGTHPDMMQWISVMPFFRGKRRRPICGRCGNVGVQGKRFLCGNRPRANTWVRPYGGKDSGI